MTPQLRSSLMVVNYAPRVDSYALGVVNYAPRIINYALRVVNYAPRECL